MGNLTQCEYNHEYRQHPAYGFYQADCVEGSNYVVVEKRLEKEKRVLQQALIRLNGKRQLKHPNIARLARYSWEQQPYCYKVLLVYQFVPKSFADRAREVDEFEEQQLLKMIDDVEKALQYLKDHSLIHSNISAQTVLYNDGTYIITDNRYLTNSTSYQKALKGSTCQLLSERLVESLRNKSQTPQYTISDDLFALGLMVLTTVTGTQPEVFYDRLKYEIRSKVIQNKLRQMGKLYSSKLIRKIKELLSEGIYLQPTMTNSLCESLDSFNEEYSVICSKLRSLRVIDF